MQSKGKRWYLSNCEISVKDARKALPYQHNKAKKARYKESRKQASNVVGIASTSSSPHSLIFKALFTKGKVESNLMTDQGADAYFISSSLLEKIQQSLPSIQKEQLGPSQIYRGITGDPCLTCHHSVKLDEFLQTRQGISLLLRNITWRVTEDNIRTHIIGGRVLESLGCENR